MWVCQSQIKSDRIDGLSVWCWKGKKEKYLWEKKLMPQLGNEPLPFACEAKHFACEASALTTEPP